MSDISSLQARLNEEKARNNQLRGYLMELGAGVSNAARRMENYRSQVNNILSDSTRKISSSHERILQAHEVQAEIDRMYIRFKNMELANKKIRECNNKKYYDFANYSTVRKIVQGMLDNLNLNMISDNIIYKSIEKQHLQTPDFWLTSVLLSIMAWKNDDRELAERAVEISMNLDKKNSAIFYMLLNIRMRREAAALKWFMVYQECELKGSDEKTFLMLFSLMSKTLQDEVEDNIKYEVIEFINKVIAMNAQAEGFSEEAVLDMIEGYFVRMKGGDKLELNMLKRCLQDYTEIADIMISAENNMAILQFILDVGNVSEIEKNEYLDQFIMGEIAKPNSVEQSVYDEIEYNELVISCNGDMQKTEQIYQANQEKKKSELNLISEMINWIYKRNNEGEVNGQVRKNMFTLTASLQKKAADQYAENYRKRVKDTHPVVLGDYQTTVDFTDRSSESRKITAHYENERNTKLGQIKNTITIVGAVLAVVGLISIIKIGGAGLIVGLVGAALAVYNVISNKRQKKQIIQTCEMNIKNKQELMDQLFEEYDQWKTLYAEYDAYFDKVKDALAQF